MMDLKMDRPRLAGRLACAGRVTPSTHQPTGRRKAIPVPPPRVPTPMPAPNNNNNNNNDKNNKNNRQHREEAENAQFPPDIVSHMDGPYDTISRITKRYLDENMQQAWINPRLISKINMEAVTSSDDYCSPSFSQGDTGSPIPTPMPTTTSTRPGHAVRYTDELADLGTRISCARLNGISKQASRITQQRPYSRGRLQQVQWGPEQHQTFADHQYRQQVPSGPRLTFYEIESPAQRLQQQERAAGNEARFGPEPVSGCALRNGRQLQAPAVVQGALPGYDQLHRQQPPPPPRYRQPPRYQQQEQGYTEVPLGFRYGRPAATQEVKQQIQEDRGGANCSTSSARRASLLLGVGVNVAAAASASEPNCLQPQVSASQQQQPVQQQAHVAAESFGPRTHVLETMRSRHEPEGQQQQQQGFRGTVNAILRAGELVQGRPCERASLRIDRCVPRMPATATAETAELKYYGELGPAATAPVLSGATPQQHGPLHYQETKFAYSVSRVPKSAAQASAAAAFFARAAHKLSSTSSPAHRRRRSGDDGFAATDEQQQPIPPNGYAAMLIKSPPPAPAALLRRIGVKERTGVGKVKVLLRVSSGEGSSFFSADKRKKQVTLVDPASAQSSTAEDRRPTVAAPKMFAFDAIFTEEDSQTEICSSALTDVIHAVINGTDGCVFCFGHAGLGKTYTMLGTAEAGHTLGAIPCAIAWLFRSISEQRQKTGARFSVRVSCMELIAGQQQLKDLLATHTNDADQPSSAYLRDDPLIQMQQHSELRVPTAERAAFYLDVACAARQREDGDTHMLYTLHVYQYSVAGKGGVAGGRSRLHLIDIGNSERGKSSGGIPLSGLGNILLAIFNGHKHLPYKDHKLAQLLRECLGSLTCHATMIAHVSPESRHYSETLTTCQLASRIHRMRRRKITRFGIGSQTNSAQNNTNNNNNGNGDGDSGDEQHQQHKQQHNSECDPSSSDLSADTVIYVGPSTDDATDGEHPPVYIPSLNSGDNRCAMSRALRGSAAERPSKIVEERSSPAHKASRAVKALATNGLKQTSPAHSSTPKASPARKSASKLAASKPAADPSATAGSGPAARTAPQGTSDEQWIDGPRVSRSKVAEVRQLLLKDPSRKKETWIDGPMGATAAALGQNGGSATPSSAATAATMTAISMNQASQHRAAQASHSDQPQQQQQHANGYGFMDSHKKSMIRKWVENQSSQIVQRGAGGGCRPAARTSAGGLAQLKELAHGFVKAGDASTDDFDPDDDDDTSLSTTTGSESLKVNEIEDITERLGAKISLLNVKQSSNTDSGLDLTGSPLMDSLERLSRSLDLLGDCRDDEDEDQDDEEIVVPPPLPLIEPLSNGVSRAVSVESLNLLSHKDALSMRPSRDSLSSEDELLEIVDVDDAATAEHARMQDSCLQVTEEDIALCMADNHVSDSGLDEHPLRILSQENLTVVSTLADSLSVLSETERLKTQFPPLAGMGMPFRSYFDHEDFLEQENRHKFDQLARLHEIYQSQLALANVANSVTYQREKSSTACTRDLLTSSPGSNFRGCPPSRCQSLSLSDVALSDAASTHGSIYSEPPYAAAATVAASVQLTTGVGHDHHHHHHHNHHQQQQMQADSKFCDNCRQSMSGATHGSNSSLGSRLAAASGSFSAWSAYNPMPSSPTVSPRRGYCVVATARANASHISSLRHPDGASNPNLKDELCGVGGGCEPVRRLPGNGESGSDPEDGPGERAKRMHRGLLPPPPASPLLMLHRLQQQQHHVAPLSSTAGWAQLDGSTVAQSACLASESSCGISDDDVKFSSEYLTTKFEFPETLALNRL